MFSKKLFVGVLPLALVLCSAISIHADVVLPDVISSGVVLQRDTSVPIWGRAEPGESVSVTFGKQTKKTTADKDGKWLIKLSPLRANATPARMTIEGKNKLELADILVGEVWLVAGQSR